MRRSAFEMKRNAEMGLFTLPSGLRPVQNGDAQVPLDGIFTAGGHGFGLHHGDDVDFRVGRQPLIDLVLAGRIDVLAAIPENFAPSTVSLISLLGVTISCVPLSYRFPAQWQEGLLLIRRAKGVEGSRMRGRKCLYSNANTGAFNRDAGHPPAPAKRFSGNCRR